MLLIFLLVMLVFSAVMTVIIVSAFIGFLRTRVPFVPTLAYDIRFIVKHLGISKKDVVYDLGSGDGKVIFLIEKLTGARGVGFELAWWIHFVATVRGKLIGSKARFYCKNFFKQDWSEATVIYGYLYPMLMATVEAKFLAECKPGSIAIIRDFPLPTLKYDEKHFMPRNHEVYVYRHT